MIHKTYSKNVKAGLKSALKRNITICTYPDTLEIIFAGVSYSVLLNWDIDKKTCVITKILDDNNEEVKIARDITLQKFYKLIYNKLNIK